MWCVVGAKGDTSLRINFAECVWTLLCDWGLCSDYVGQANWKLCWGFGGSILALFQRQPKPKPILLGLKKPGVCWANLNLCWAEEG